MVRVLATQVIDVQGHLRMVNKAMEEFREEINIELANLGALERHIHDQAGAPRQIDHDAG